MRELDERLGLSELMQRHLSDFRRGKNIQLPLADLLRQSIYSRLAGYEDVNDAARTGWPEAVTRLRLPRNVACGFPALRSSEVGLQRSDSLQLPVWEKQLWPQQRRLRPDLMEHLPSDAALPAPAAKHLVPVSFHGPIYPLQRAEISGDAEVRVVSAE